MGATIDTLRRPVRTADRRPLALAGAIASLGAGLIHATAAGTHADHAVLAGGFVLVAVAQVGTGAALASRPTSSSAALALTAVNAVALIAWAVTRVTGIGVEGLGAAQPVGLADAIAATLALAAVGVGLAVTIGHTTGRRRAPVAAPVAGIAALCLAVTAIALVDATRHDHAAHDHAAHDDAASAAPGHAHDTRSDPDHDGAVVVADDRAHETVHDDDHDHDHEDDVAHAHDHGTPAVPPAPYDPRLPIDLGGVAGVTLEQQAFAENLVAVTLRYLPQWSDPTVAEAAGFRSIGDAVTGHEHYVNWSWIDDEVWLDPNAPESLVYEVGPDGSRTLVSAMYMLPPSMSLEEVPDWGGALLQWHVHEDLCYTDDPDAPRVAAVIPIGGTCPSGLVAKDPAPMVHVWITPHPCGPFAALEGVAAGQVRAGEEHRCHHVHGVDDPSGR